MNRISDVIFILGVVLILLLFYNTDYSLVFDLIHPYLELGYDKIIFFLFFFKYCRSYLFFFIHG